METNPNHHIYPNPFFSSPPRLESNGQTERLVTDVELAAQLGISRRFVHTLKSRGVLRAVRLGTALRFPLGENLARVLVLGDSGDPTKGGTAA
jgi:excisionase family DNA binding protein